MKKNKLKRYRKLVYVLLPLLLILCAFFIMKNFSQKSKQFDTKRQENLADIIQKNEAYLSHNPVLPKSLDELYGYYHNFIDNQSSMTPPVDPQTKTPYTYKRISDDSYQICAAFSAETDPKIFSYTGIEQQDGKQCFIINSKKPAEADTKGPSATVSSLERTGSCAWRVTFHLQGFLPSNPINAHSKGRRAEACNPTKTADYEWTQHGGFETNDNGTSDIYFDHNDYGSYTYTFTDTSGQSASVPVSYTLTPTPGSAH